MLKNAAGLRHTVVILRKSLSSLHFIARLDVTELCSVGYVNFLLHVFRVLLYPTL